MISEPLVSEELGGFRMGRACVDHIFSLRQPVKKVKRKRRRLMQHIWIRKGI